MENSNKNEEKGKSWLSQELILSKKVSLVEKYNFYEYLSVMVDSWVTISDALDSVVIRLKSPYFKRKIGELNTYLSSGDSFSKSMKKVPQIFDQWEISIVESWETTWMLVESLQKLSNDLKRVDDLRKKVKWALTYPFIIMLFLVLAVLAVMIYVIPSLTPLFETAEVELPAMTKALIATSDFIIYSYWYIILIVATIIFVFVFYKSTIEWRKKLDKTLLWIPLLWRVYQNYVLSSIASSMWSLIGSGVNIVKALTLTWKSSWSLLYESLFDEIIQKVSKWEKIVASMEEVDPGNEYFPIDFLQMLSVWERTARLEDINKKIHNQYVREVDYSLANLTKWVEPIAILIAWVFVLWFAFAIFWAILKVTQTVW